MSFQKRLNALYSQARLIENPVERAAFLDRVCEGDPDLRVKLNQMLDLHFSASEMDSTHLSDRTDLNETHFTETRRKFSSGVLEKPMDRVGPYELIEEIGEGGMGTVWVAQQTHPIRRKVALKLIKPGMDSRAVLARFEAERQALAMMEHPNIARVFDGGITDEGRPYFAMEYVEGIPLTKYCNLKRLNLKERLRLFLPVCYSIQHAHQKGIIHRDLKPSNILVGSCDGQPVPKVIDFGLAKAVHDSLTDLTLYTGHGVMLGTPLYMSPEQAQLKNPDIDTRTDIYSLGIILYELLCGYTPIDRSTITELSGDDFFRLIKEVDPPKPSTRISNANSQSEIAKQRQTDETALKHQLAGDLDCVVMKTLDKERERRYQTANELAEDLKRYLSNKPVNAAPPSRSYRIRKFIQRNRVAVISSSVLSCVVVLGILGTTLSLIRALDAESATARSLNIAKQLAKKAQEQRNQSEERFQLALDAIRSYHEGISQDLILGDEQFSDIRERLLSNSIAFYDRLVGSLKKESDPTARLALAKALCRLGIINSKIGERAKSKAAFDQSIELLEELNEQTPNNPMYLEPLVEINVSRFIDWVVHEKQDSMRAADSVNWEKILNYSQQLASHRPNDHYVKSILLLCEIRLANDARTHDGTEMFVHHITNCKALIQQINTELISDIPNRVNALAYLDSAVLWLLLRNETPLALSLEDKIIRGYEEIIDDEEHQETPELSSIRINLAEAYDKRAMIHTRLKRPKLAFDDLRKEIQLLSEVLDKKPNLTLAIEKSGKACYSLSRRHLEADNAEEALSYIRKALKFFDAAIRKDNTRSMPVLMHSISHSLEGEILLKLGKYQEAIIVLQAPEVFAHPGNVNLNSAPIKIAYAQAKLGQIDEAVKQVKAFTVGAEPQLQLELAKILAVCCEQVRQSSNLSQTERNEQMDQFATQAINILLQDEVSQLPGLADQIKEDPDWSSIKQRADFQKVLAKITP